MGKPDTNPNKAVARVLYVFYLPGELFTGTSKTCSEYLR
jgi:hypothetical protein